MASGAKSGRKPAAPPLGKAAQAVDGFDLLRHLPHLLRRAHFDAEASFPAIYGDDITSRQLAIMSALAGQPGLSQSAAAQIIGIDLNTCSDLVARLISRKLIARERSETDGRAYVLKLTRSGEAVVVSAMAKTPDYAEAVARRLDAKERVELIQLLRKLLGIN